MVACHLLYGSAHAMDRVDVLCTIHGMHVWCRGYLDRRGTAEFEWLVDFYDTHDAYEGSIVVSLASEEVSMLDNGHIIDMHEFLSRMVEEIILEHEFFYLCYTD